MLKKKLNNRSGVQEITQLLFFGVGTIKFSKELNSGDGEHKTTKKIIKHYLKFWYPEFSRLSILKYHIYLAPQFMESVMGNSIRVEIFTIGEYGLEAWTSNLIDKLLGHLIASLEHKVCLFGIQ